MKTAAFGVNIQPNKLEQYNASILFGKFTDGNKRANIHLNTTQNILHDAKNSIDVRGYINLEKNTEKSRPYYNPEKAYQIGTNVEYNGLLHQQYEERYSHTLSGDLSLYKEENFNEGATWKLLYEHQWQPSRDLNFIYGIETGENIYDGDHESFDRINLGINWSF